MPWIVYAIDLINTLFFVVGWSLWPATTQKIFRGSSTKYWHPIVIVRMVTDERFPRKTDRADQTVSRRDLKLRGMVVLTYYHLQRDQGSPQSSWRGHYSDRKSYIAHDS